MQDGALTAAFYEDLGRDDLTDRNAVVARMFVAAYAASFLRTASPARSRTRLAHPGASATHGGCQAPPQK